MEEGLPLDFDLIYRGLWRYYQSWHKTLQARLIQRANEMQSWVSNVIVSYCADAHTPLYLQYQLLNYEGDFFIETTCDPDYPPRSYYSWTPYSLNQEPQALWRRLLDQLKLTLHSKLCPLWWEWAMKSEDPSTGLTLDQYVSLLQKCNKQKK